LATQLERFETVAVSRFPVAPLPALPAKLVFLVYCRLVTLPNPATAGSSKKNSRSNFGHKLHKTKVNNWIL